MGLDDIALGEVNGNQSALRTLAQRVSVHGEQRCLDRLRVAAPLTQQDTRDVQRMQSPLAQL